MKNSITQNKVISKIIIALLWLAIWQVAYMIIDMEVLFVSPVGVLKTLFNLVQDGLFWQSVFASFFRVLEGYIIAVILGAVVAVVTLVIPFAYDFFYPIISLVRAAPVVSFIILTLVWLKSGTVPAFISFLMVFPVVWTNVSEGIRRTDKKLLEMAKIFNFGKLKTIENIYIPSVLPFFKTACVTGLSLAWKSGIAAEVICTPKLSIGKQLYNSKIYLETPELFAWTAVVVIMSVIVEKLFVMLINFVVDRYYLRRRC